jgi:hypothetical protein
MKAPYFKHHAEAYGLRYVLIGRECTPAVRCIQIFADKAREEQEQEQEQEQEPREHSLTVHCVSTKI